MTDTVNTRNNANRSRDRDRAPVFREQISQAEAARRRGVGSERISQLIESGRLSIARQEGRNIWLFADEVENLRRGSQGRPPLGADERRRRAERLGFPLGAVVRWQTQVGRRFIDLEAVVHRNGTRRVYIEDLRQSGKFHWAKPEDLELSPDQSEARSIEPSRRQRLVPLGGSEVS